MNHFVGAANFSQVKLFSIDPTEKHKGDRLDAMMSKQGIAVCSKAENCVAVCPEDILNLEFIATVARPITVAAITRFFGG